MLCKEPLVGKTMKLLAALLLLAASLFAAPAPAKEAKPDLAKSTLIVYQGKQVCKWTISEDFFFFGPSADWGCEFKVKFTCTATVIDADGNDDYLALSAGHCFDWKAVDKGEYYVSDTLSDKPVVHRITLQKFENDDRYDFAVFSFKSYESYKPIPIAKNVNPKSGDDVVNVNYSLGLEKETISGKVVSSIIASPAIKSYEDTKGRFLVAIGVGPGASGSAIVDNKTGEIIGLVEAIFPATQMPTVVMPTGQTLLHFMEDDSAGLRPLPPGPLPKAPKQHVPTFKELVFELLDRIWNKLHFWS